MPSCRVSSNLVLSWMILFVCPDACSPRGLFWVSFSCYLPIQPFFYVFFCSHILLQNCFVSFASSCWFLFVHSPLICWLNFFHYFRMPMFAFIVWPCCTIFWVSLFFAIYLFLPVVILDLFVIFCSFHSIVSLSIFLCVVISLVAVSLFVILASFPIRELYFCPLSVGIRILSMTCFLLVEFSDVVHWDIFYNLFTFSLLYLEFFCFWFISIFYSLFYFQFLIILHRVFSEHFWWGKVLFFVFFCCLF